MRGLTFGMACSNQNELPYNISICSRILIFILLCLAFRILPVNTVDSRQNVSLHIIAHMYFEKGYQRTLDNTLKKARNSHSREYAFAFSQFNPMAKVIRLSDDHPGEILDRFCNDIFRETSTTVLHIINPFEHFRSQSAQFVSNLIAFVGLPVITWGPEYAASSSRIHDEVHPVQISPTLHQQAEAMFSLLEQFDWGQFSVVYTNHSGHVDFLNAVRLIVHERNSYLTDYPTKKPRTRFCQLSELEIRNPDDVILVRQDLNALVNTDTRIILMYAHEHETRSILEAATHQGLVSREFAWIIAFEAIPKGRDNLAADLPIGLLGVQYASDEVEMNSAVQTAARIWLKALNASSYDIMSGLPAWQLPSLQCNSDRPLFWCDGHRFFEYLHNATQQTDNEEEEPTYQPKITIVNSQEDDSETRWVEVGTWTPRGLSMKRISWLGGAAGPPSGKPERYNLRVVTRPEEPNVIYRNLTGNGTCEDTTIICRVFPRDEDGRKLSNNTVFKCCTGLSIDLLLHIKQSLNFDVDMYEVEDFQWGNKDRKGNWDGLIRELLTGRAHLAVTSLRISEDRAQAVSFSEPYLETGITIIVAIREGAISATAFLEPYDYPSWCLILVFSVHTVGASIFICEWLSPYGMDRGRVRLTEHKFSLFRTFWLMWAMLFGAAVSTNSPRGISSKFLANIWALFAVVFLASYTANLAAFMITKEEYFDLTGIQDWRLQNPQWMKPSFKYGTIPNTSTESNILKNNRDMYLYMQKYNQQSVQDAIHSLKTQQLHAFIYDATVLEYQVGKDVGCRLITVGKWYAMSGYGIAFPVGSPWLQKINTVILEMQAKGDIERLKEFWLAGACHTKQKKSQNNKGITGGVSSSTLGILNFTSAFILLGAGTGLAALTFLLEHCLFWFGRRRLSTWDKKGCCTLISMSMGMSLTFQQSVHDALQLHKTHRCPSSVCQNQLWKANRRLDMARLHIDRLKKEIAALAQEKETRSAEVWTYDPDKVEVKTDNGHTRPNQDVYISEGIEEPACPKVTLL